MSREKTLEKLVITLEAKVEKYEKDLAKAKKSSRSFAKSAKNDIIDVKQAIIGLGAGYVIHSMVENTAKQEQAVKQLEQGLASTGQVVGLSLKELTRYASELQGVTNFGDEEIIEGMSQLVTFTNLTRDEFKAATVAALDLSTRMDQDLKSSIVQIGKALNDPILGISALSRTGIQFSEDQKAMIKALAETGHVADAQRMILKELELQFGGSARAARETFGGALTSLNNAFGDLLEANDGLEEARESIEGLTIMLSDPTVVQGVNSLTAAIVGGFSGALHFISEVTSAIGFLAEEFAAFVHGPAIGDAVRLDEQIASVTERILELESAKSRSNANQNELAALKAQLRTLQEKLRITNEINDRGSMVIGITNGTVSDDKQEDPTPDVNLNSKLRTWESLMDDYKKVADDSSSYVEDSFVRAFDSMNTNFSRTLGQAIIEGDSLKDTMGQVAKTFGVDVVSGLIKIGTQMAINSALGKAAQAESAATAMVTGPQIAAAYAPAATMTSVASFGSSAAMALTAIAAVAALTSGLSMVGMAHDGIANVPKEGTWLLDKGERVLSAQQNKDFTDYIKSDPQAGGGVSVTNVFQISAGVSGTVQQEIKKMLPDFERLSVSAVETAIRRGGSLARTVGRR